VPTITPTLLGTDTAGFIQTFNNRNAGTAKTLAPAGAVNDGNGGANYAVTFANNLTGVITAQAITVTAVTSTKPYDGTVSSAGVPTITPALLGTDTAGFTQTFINRNAGTAKTLTPAGVVNDGNGGANYAVTFVNSLTGAITAQAITVSAVTDTKPYDGSVSSSGVPNILPALLGTDTTGFTQTFNNRNAGTAKTLTPAGVVNDGNGGANYAVTFANNLTGVITARSITVTAVTDTKSYDGTVSSSGVPTITPGLLGTDTAGFTQTFNNRNAGTAKTLTPAGVVNDGNGGANYAVTFANNLTGVITARSITVTAVTDTKPYDGTVSSSGAPTIAPTLLGTDTAGFTQTFNNRNAGTAKTLMPTGAVNDGNGGANYAVTFANNLTGVITAQAITVTAVAASKVYDGTTTATGTPTLSPPLIPGDTTTTLMQAFLSATVGIGNKVIVPAITIGDGNGGNNYSVTLQNFNSGTITQALATIVLGDLTQTYTSSPMSVTATTNPAGRSMSISYDGSGTAPTNAGTYAVVATITDPNYSGAAIGSLVISPAPATISLGGLTQAYTGAPRPVTTTTNPAGKNVSVSYDGSGTAPTNVGTYAVVATITDPNYSGTASGNLVITADAIATWKNAHFTANEIAAGLANDGADADGDGVSNRNEYIMGTDPRAFGPQPLSIVRTPGGQLELHFDARSATGPGYDGLTRKYTLEGTSDLTNPTAWNGVVGFIGITATGQSITVQEAGGGSCKFYRLKVILE